MNAAKHNDPQEREKNYRDFVEDPIINSLVSKMARVLELSIPNRKTTFRPHFQDIS